MKKIILTIFIIAFMLSAFGYFIFTTKKPVAYFTVWDGAAFEGPCLRLLANALSNSKYDHLVYENLNIKRKKYILSTKIQKYDDFKLKKHDLNFVVWKEFYIPPLSIKNQSYLWLLESPISITVPPTDEHIKHFKKIFTWYKAATNNKNIIYVPIPYSYDKIKRNYDIKSKQYLVSQVASKGWSGHYVLREKSVHWFLENHPDDIRFFGSNWNNITKILSPKAQEKFKTQYGGYVKDKIDEIAKAKFVLSYENTRFPDYISEKIYDVMAAGSVPIYSGAPNITDYVPKECFIDFHAFKNHEELYHYISTMSDEKYNSYLNCISKFMENPEKHENHSINVTKTILKHLDI